MTTKPDVVQALLESGRASHQLYPLGRCRVEGPVHIADNSILFRAECSGLPGSAAVKVCRNPKDQSIDSSVAAEQYHALLRLNEVWPEDATRQRVVRPYALFAGDATVVLEWVQGCPLTEALLGFRTSMRKACELAREAGEWLAVFHRTGHLAIGELDLDWRISVVEEMRWWPTGSDRVFQRSVDSLAKSAPAATRLSVSKSWVHGDFKADNLLVGKDRLTGIDVGLRHTNPVVYDIGSFLNHLELACLDPRNPWRLLHHKRLAACFLDGYSRDGEPPEALALAWTRLYQLMFQWDSMLKRTRRISPARFMLDYAFALIAGQLCEELSGAGLAQ